MTYLANAIPFFQILSYVSAAVDVTHFVDIFRDDFDADGFPDQKKWNIVSKASMVKDELQWYRRENVKVYDGNLHIETRQEVLSAYNTTRDYTSGRVYTQGFFDFQYGEVEWRAKVPGGKGLWPALWLLHYQCDPAVPCRKWPTAVSVSRGDTANQSVQQVTNWKYPQGRLPSKNTESRNNTVGMQQDLSLDFHVYKLIWTSELLIWVIDDVQIFNVTGDKDVPSTRMQLVMSVAVGGMAGPPPPETIFPTDFLIDYVVVRQPANVTIGRMPPGPPYIMPLLVGLFGGLVLFLIILGIAILIVWRRRRKSLKKKKSNQAAELEIRRLNSYHNDLSSVYRSASIVEGLQDPVVQRYLSLLEIPISNLNVTQELLGKGQYGLVWKGYVRNLLGSNAGEEQPVAVKTLVDYDNPEQQKQFLDEMKLMSKIGRHLNIVNLVGITSAGKFLLIMEYCRNGCLLKFLRGHRKTFSDQVDADGYLVSRRSNVPAEQAPETPTGYVRVVSTDYVSATAALSERTASVTESDGGENITTCDLVNFGYQISKGLEFLALQSIIHRDIAARNILVADNMVVKIADFGMARERLEEDYILKNEQVPLPIKWMAPESIQTKRFSYKSDVWSFGILLWEIFSLGEMPYTTTTGSTFSGHVGDFVNALNTGMRMQRPPYAPSFMYEIMCRCWELQIEDRPCIETIRRDFASFVTDASTEYYLKLEEPYLNYNRMLQMVMDSPQGPQVPLGPQASTGSSAYQQMDGMI